MVTDGLHASAGLGASEQGSVCGMLPDDVKDIAN